MQAIYALLCLVFPLISTLILFRGSRLWDDPVAERLGRAVVYAILHLLPIQLLGALELMHVAGAVTLFRVALFDLLILAGNGIFLANLVGVAVRLYRARATAAYAAVTAEIKPAGAQT